MAFLLCMKRGQMPRASPVTRDSRALRAFSGGVVLSRVPPCHVDCRFEQMSDVFSSVKAVDVASTDGKDNKISQSERESQIVGKSNGGKGVGTRL